jgi:NAD(P) transhydrogenase subunit alpha
MLTFIPSGSFAGIAVALPGAAAGPDVMLAQLDILAAASGGTMHAVSGGAVDPFVFRLSIFVLAVFVGYFVVWSVTPALHTPLMSVTNAISSVIVVGALLAVGVALVANDSGPVWARAFGFIALVFASVNIFGGFLVTQRMLGMYQKKESRSKR